MVDRSRMLVRYSLQIQRVDQAGSKLLESQHKAHKSLTLLKRKLKRWPGCLETYSRRYLRVKPKSPDPRNSCLSNRILEYPSFIASGTLNQTPAFSSVFGAHL